MDKNSQHPWLADLASPVGSYGSCFRGGGGPCKSAPLATGKVIFAYNFVRGGEREVII